MGNWVGSQRRRIHGQSICRNSVPTTSSYRYDPLGRNSILSTGGDHRTLAHDTVGAPTDHLTSAGVIAVSKDWTPFGTARTAVGAPTASGSVSSIGYAGMLEARTPGLAQNVTRDRHYLNGDARWTAVDPITQSVGAGFDSTYTYVKNQPSVFIDPLGQSPVWWDGYAAPGLEGLGQGLKTFGVNTFDGVAAVADDPTLLWMGPIATWNAGWERSGLWGAATDVTGLSDISLHVMCTFTLSQAGDAYGANHHWGQAVPTALAAIVGGGIIKKFASSSPSLPSNPPSGGATLGQNLRGTALDDTGAVGTSTISGRIKTAGLPNSGSIRYLPPINYRPGMPLPRGAANGYIDRFGNEWVKGPSRTVGESFEWDVQLSHRGQASIGRWSTDGEHVNVSQGGWVTH